MCNLQQRFVEGCWERVASKENGKQVSHPKIWWFENCVGHFQLLTMAAKKRMFHEI